MISAIWRNDRAYCGRDGCKNRASFARLADEQGRASFGDRWELEEDSSPPRFTHADRPTFTVGPNPKLARATLSVMRASVRRGKGNRTTVLPAVFVCPTCGTPNLLDDPRPVG